MSPSTEAVPPPRAERPPTWGDAALASLVVATVSGVILLVPYDAHAPTRSLAAMLLANPAAAWFRNIHFWSAQAFLVLTGVHAWSTLRHGSEARLPPGVWVRVAVGVPLAGALMLSGFLLRGDLDAGQALRILATTLEQIPGLGNTLRRLLTGTGGLQVAYGHHVATFTLLTWVVVVEHARRGLPTRRALLRVLVPVALISAAVSPSLHDGLDPLVKGPWYFVGLQEALHWSSGPRPVLAVAALLLVVMAGLRSMPPRVAVRARLLLAIALVAYGLLTAVGTFCRGADWAWRAPWEAGESGLVRGWLWKGLAVPASELRSRPVPEVLGRPEGCLFCHAGVEGLGRSHDPASIGCASCHRGYPYSLDPAVAHRDMAIVPGNLATAGRTCGTSACHDEVVPRVRRSIMTTARGIVEVDRWAWGEGSRPGGASASPAEPGHVEHLGHAGADSHLRHLCASCHVGAVKATPAPITQESRGGGCTACHLQYSPEARTALSGYLRDRGHGIVPPAAHPALALATGDEACFGCHSRSGRISLSYEGWHEADPAPSGPAEPARTLEDGRTVYRATPDAHHSRRMGCRDCHTAREVMGDGQDHARKTDALKVRCEDCHADGPMEARPVNEADAETRIIRTLRPGPAPDRPMRVAASGEIMENTFVGADGRARLHRKADGAVLDLRAPARACRDGVHGRVSCVACHSAWAPRCDTCHTRFDPAREGFDLLAGRAVKGDWVEEGSRSSATPPTLGMRRTPRGDVVDGFVPGMIATLDARGAAPAAGGFSEDARPGPTARSEPGPATGNAPADPPGRSSGIRPAPTDPLFRRLYARVSPHTVTRKGRSCRSCHADPVALGYGEGRLAFEPRGRRGEWTFAPAHPVNPRDGLPADAWIGFLSTRSGDVSTRGDVRPLSVEEQRRVLGPGVCLECHAEDSSVMRETLRGFEAVVRRASPRCRQPGGTAGWGRDP